MAIFQAFSQRPFRAERLFHMVPFSSGPLAMNLLSDQVMAELCRTRRLDLSGYRRAVIEKRLVRRMAALGLGDPVKYLERLRTDPAECDRLIDALLVKVSSFFRNPIVFELIAQQVVPRIIHTKRRSGSSEIRVWSAGCATGEEAYSVAILIYEALQKEEFPWRPYIFATDLSQTGLGFAELGRYPRECFEETRLGILERYFTVTDDGFEVCPEIREMVRFSTDDLTSDKRFAPADSVFGTFDLVLCRNVLIYFSADLQKRVFAKLYRSLSRNGYLVLGNSESLPPGQGLRLTEVDSINRIFLKTG